MIPVRKTRQGLTQKPFWQTRPEPTPHPDSSVQGRGHGPTAFAGADVYSFCEPTAQKISTGRPSQPQRPPGSMQEGILLGATHLPLLPQPPVKPQRCPEGHCASFVQVIAPWVVPRFSKAAGFVACAWVLPHATMSPRTKATTCVNGKQIFPISLNALPPVSCDKAGSMSVIGIFSPANVQPVGPMSPESTSCQSFSLLE